MMFQQPLSLAAAVDLALAQIFFIISIVALAFSVGLFIAIIYLLKRGQFFQGVLPEHAVSQAGGEAPESYSRELESLRTKVEDLEQRMSDIEEKIPALEKRVSSVEEVVKGVRSQLSTFVSQLAGIEKKIQNMDARLNYLLRSGKSVVKQPMFAPSMVRGEKEIPRIGELNSLGDLKLYVPQLQYVALITSQGYLVEKYGQLSEDPPKLLEVVKISEKFTNSREITIVRGDQRISIFYVGKSEDLDVYGILAVKKDVPESVIGAIQEAIVSYFRRRYGA